MTDPVYTCQIAFAANPFDVGPAWTDVSGDLMNFHIRRGRQWELNRMEAGTATICLRNQHGNYWPTNTTGAYYPNILPWKRITIREGSNLLTNGSFELGDPPNDWTVEGPGGTLSRSSIQHKVGSYSALLTRNGADCDFFQAIRGAGAGDTVTLGMWVYATVANRARLRIFDGFPHYSAYHTGSGTWEWLTLTRVLLGGGSCFGVVDTGDTSAYFDGAMLMIGATVTQPNTNMETLPAYDLFTGYIEAWQPGFIMEPIIAPIMTLSCADGLKNVALHSLTATSSYSAEVAGTRVDNILNDVGWPASTRTIATGQSLCQSTGPMTDINALTHIQDVQDTELGILFVAPASGTMVFQDRQTRLTFYATSSATFGDSGTDLRFSSINLAFEDLRIYNDVRVTAVGGTEQVSTVTSSIDAYGRRSLVRPSLLMTTDESALGQAQYLSNKWSSPVMRCKEFTLTPNSDPTNLYPIVFGYDLSRRVTIKLTQAGLNKDYYIEGINLDWDVTDPGGIQATYMVSDARQQQDWQLNVDGLASTTLLSY